MDSHRKFAQGRWCWRHLMARAGLLQGIVQSLALACMLQSSAFAQSPRTPPATFPMDASEPSVRNHGRNPFTDPTDAAREMRRLQQLNVMRQRSMVNDAAKLLQLAQELNAELASGNSSSSLQQRMHRIAEIEKLAKSVKEKMRFETAAPQEFSDPFH